MPHLKRSLECREAQLYHYKGWREAAARFVLAAYFAVFLASLNVCLVILEHLGN